MSAVTEIEWTDRTWNPVTGCTKVSPGCAHCYAEGVANRFWPSQYLPIQIVDPNKPQRIGGKPNSTRPRAFTDVQCHEDRLLEPLSWRKPARVFVNSMSDLFHEDVSDEFIDQVFAVMALAGRHTFQVLTKRPERMRAYFADPYVVERVELQLWERHTDDTTNAVSKWPLPNVWLGVSVENQKFADERIPLLLQTPAAVRFISAEPLLGPLVLGGIHVEENADETTLDWVIVGGESGGGARPFDLAWARSIVAHCHAAGVACFVKQVGARPQIPSLDGSVAVPLRLRDRKGGDPSEWPEDLRVRLFPT